MLRLRKAAEHRINVLVTWFISGVDGMWVPPCLRFFFQQVYRRFNPMQLQCPLCVAKVMVTVMYLETVVAGSRQSRVGLGHTVWLLI